MASTRRFPVSYFELLLAAGIVAPHGLLSAEKAAPEKTKPDSAIVWHDCKDIGVEGKGWTGTGAAPTTACRRRPRARFRNKTGNLAITRRTVRPLPDRCTVASSPLGASGERGQQVLRIALAFDPDRNGILLVGGDKSGISEKRFYKQLIKKADELYAAHLAALKAKKKGKK